MAFMLSPARHLSMEAWKENAGYQERILISNRLNAAAELLVIFSVSFQKVRSFLDLSLIPSKNPSLPQYPIESLLLMSSCTYEPPFFKEAMHSAIQYFKPFKALLHAFSFDMHRLYWPRKALLSLLTVPVAKVGRRAAI